jgi:DNA invertase Pin-like site-specific DNA recombinase
MEENNSLRVKGYIRVSTEEQEKGGVSLADQRRRLKAQAEAKNFPEITLLEEPEAISASKISKRTAYQELLELIEAKEVDVIMVTATDRIFRDMREEWNLRDEWKTQGIRFIAIDEGIDEIQGEHEHPDKKMTRTILAAMRQREREITQWRTLKAMKHKMEVLEKRGGEVPDFGYDIDEVPRPTRKNPQGKLRLLKKNEEETTTVELMLELDGRGYSLRQICAELEARGILTKTGNARWQPRVVSRILKREAIRRDLSDDKSQVAQKG